MFKTVTLLALLAMVVFVTALPVEEDKADESLETAEQWGYGGWGRGYGGYGGWGRGYGGWGGYGRGYGGWGGYGGYGRGWGGHRGYWG